MSIKRVVAGATAVVVGCGLGFGIANALSPQAPAGANSAARPASAGAAVVRPVSEDLFVPVPNCRAVNTLAAGGRIADGQTRSFVIKGTTGFQAQGGTPGGCGIPAGATAISARVTALGAQGNGAFYVYPSDQPPGYGTIYYAKGVNVTTGSTLGLALGSGAVLSARGVLGPAYLIVDVNGYYLAPMTAYISGTDGTVLSGNRVVSSTRTGAGQYTVTFDRSLYGCVPMVTVPGGAGVSGNGALSGPDSVGVETWLSSGGQDTDESFYLTVTC